MGETIGEHLRDDENVGSQRGLQHDGHIRGVEELDGIRTTLTTETVALDRDFDAETLEVDNDSENNDSSDQVHNVRKTVTPERFTKGTALVVPGEEKVEERDDGALKLGSTSSVDGSRRESLPDDGFADVGSNEKRNSGAQSVSLLQKLVEKYDDEGSSDELQD